MQIKNRKFNVAGVTFYKNDVHEGELVNFELEPNNTHDKNAIKVLNKHNQMLGHIPKENAKEIQSFLKGKYPHYCAKVVETWTPDDEDFEVPKILAHFANNPSELPFASQEWKDNLYGLSRKPTPDEASFNRLLFFFLIVFSLIVWYLVAKFTDSYLFPTFASALVIWLGIKWLTRDR